MRAPAKALLMQGTVIPAVPLVLDANRQHDEAGQRRLLRYYLNAGVGGLAVAVHTTQFAIREPSIGLFEPMLRIAVDEIAAFEKAQGKTVLRIAGACGPATQAVKEAELARSLGYDAVLLSPGGLASLSEADLIERTRQVAEVLPVIGFYLQPAVGGRVFTYAYWQSVCAIPNVVAVKCAAFDRYLTLDVARAIAMSGRAGDIALYTGNDDNIVCDLLTKYIFTDGGVKRTVSVVGGLLGHWAVWTRRAVEIQHQLREAAVQANIPTSLLTLAAEVTDTNAVFFDKANAFHGCIAGIHEVLRRQRLMPGIWCLDPAEGLSPGQAEEIDRVYRMYPHLNDDAFAAAFLQEEAQRNGK